MISPVRCTCSKTKNLLLISSPTAYFFFPGAVSTVTTTLTTVTQQKRKWNQLVVTLRLVNRQLSTSAG